MSDRSIPTAGRAALAVSLVLLALSCALLWRSSYVTDRGRRAIAAAEARAEARRAVMLEALDRQEREIAELGAALEEMAGEERQLAGRRPMGARID